MNKTGNGAASTKNTRNRMTDGGRAMLKFAALCAQAHGPGHPYGGFLAESQEEAERMKQNIAAACGNFYDAAKEIAQTEAFAKRMGESPKDFKKRVEEEQRRLGEDKEVPTVANLEKRSMEAIQAFTKALEDNMALDAIRIPVEGSAFEDDFPGSFADPFGKQRVEELVAAEIWSRQEQGGVLPYPEQKAIREAYRADPSIGHPDLYKNDTRGHDFGDKPVRMSAEDFFDTAFTAINADEKNTPILFGTHVETGGSAYRFVKNFIAAVEPAALEKSKESLRKLTPGDATRRLLFQTGLTPETEKAMDAMSAGDLRAAYEEPQY